MCPSAQGSEEILYAQLGQQWLDGQTTPINTSDLKWILQRIDIMASLIYTRNPHILQIHFSNTNTQTLSTEHTFMCYSLAHFLYTWLQDVPGTEALKRWTSACLKNSSMVRRLQFWQRSYSWVWLLMSAHFRAICTGHKGEQGIATSPSMIVKSFTYSDIVRHPTPSKWPLHPQQASAAISPCGCASLAYVSRIMHIILEGLHALYSQMGNLFSNVSVAYSCFPFG